MVEIPFETTLLVRDTCLCLASQRAARALARLFDEALRPLDLTNGQFSLLMSLNRPKPPTISSVAEFLAMDRTTLTAALKPLQRRRLIRVTVDPNDRRGPAGKATEVDAQGARAAGGGGSGVEAPSPQSRKDAAPAFGGAAGFASYAFEAYVAVVSEEVWSDPLV